MKHFVAALLVAGAVAAQTDVKRLAPDEIRQLLEEKVFLLDVRPAEEIAQLGTLKGYVNIPLDQLEQRMGEIPKNKRILTACSGGTRAAKAAAMLQAKGYDVAGACGLKGLDKEGIELIYPKPEKRN